MRTHSNNDMKYQLAVFYSQARLLMVGLGCICFSCWLNRSHGDPSTIQAGARTKGLCQKTYNRVPFPKTTHTQLIEFRDGELEDGSLYLLSSLFSRGLYSSGYQKRNMDTHQTTKPFTYNLSCMQDVLGQWCLRTWGVANHLRPIPQVSDHGLHSLKGWIQRLDITEIQGKIRHNWRKEKKSM